MRIAHIITRLILGGAQENTILNCQELISHYNDEVLLIAGPGLGPEGGLEEDAKRRGIPLRIIPSLRRPIHPMRDWQSHRAIRKALIVFKPDIVHTHSGKAGLLGRSVAFQLSKRSSSENSKGANTPRVVHTVHGAPFHSYQSPAARWFFKRCEKYAALRCHAIISVADAMTDQLVAASIAPRKKFTTIYSGMEVDSFLQSAPLREVTRKTLGYKEDDIVVIKIARLFHLKGHADVINAAKLAVSKNKRLKFLFVGDGVLRNSLEQQIAKSALQKHFQLIGLVPPQQIPSLLAASDMTVHASYREGLARVLPQTLLAGKPPISYDIDGAKEVVLHNKTGLLVPAGSTTKLAESILKLASDKELRAELAATGRELCQTQFDFRTMTQQIRGIYKRILE